MITKRALILMDSYFCEKYNGAAGRAAGAAAGAAPPQQQQPFPTQFPSLSGVTTISKREFNKASNSIQVDGAVEITTDTKKV